LILLGIHAMMLLQLNRLIAEFGALFNAGR
jgi:hypothetical protein